MRIERIMAAVLGALSCTLCAAACTQSTEATIEITETEDSAQTSTDVSVRAEEDLAGPRTIRCAGGGMGAECQSHCSAAGIECSAERRHPHKEGAGRGLLSLCRSAQPRAICVYYYESTGEECWFVPGYLFPRCKPREGGP